MKTKWLLPTVLGLISFLLIFGFSSHAQKPAKALTLLYSNNINGEIDPCPT